MGNWGLHAPRSIADAVLAGLVVAIVFMMLVPLPAVLLDLLIGGNMAFALLMLLTAVYGGAGLTFAAMPTALLIGALYRLALNVSSTRLILLDAHAGSVIDAFGSFVVRGDYVVGAVIFVILTIIQFFVIARGAERVAEVAARFTLDAMPGKQLAIDSEARSGQLGQEQARRARHELNRESQFYGAMDGAMKFVKGDALASLLIVAIDLAAGLYVGMERREMPLLQSLQVYGLLSIGDGLSAQLPALLMSTAAGIVVTRVAGPDGGESLGQSLYQQLLSKPEVLRTAGLFLCLLSAVPGLPWVPFATLGAVVFALSALPAPQTPPAKQPWLGDSGTAPFALELGQALYGPLQAALRGRESHLRQRLFVELGLPLPPVVIRANSGLADRAYQIRVRDLTAARGQIPAGTAQSAASDLLTEAMAQTARLAAAQLLDLQTVQDTITGLEQAQPAQVQGLVPNILSLPDVAQLLRQLVDEQVSIRPLGWILETAARQRADGHAQNASELLERVRLDLAPHICDSRADAQSQLRVLPLDPFVEDTLEEHVMSVDARRQLALPPELADSLLAALEKRVANTQGQTPPALLTRGTLRPLLRELIKDRFPDIGVLSYPELAPGVSLQRLDPLAP